MLGRVVQRAGKRVERTEGGDARPRPLGAPLRPRSHTSSARRSTINDEPHTVVGVLPASFDFASVFAPGIRFDLYFPFPLSPRDQPVGQHHGDDRPAEAGRDGGAGARRGPHAGRADHRGAPASATTSRASVRPLADHVSGDIRLAVWVLAGAVGMVMLIVCANLSNLLLARTASRQKEIAIRTALGAGRGRLLAQMLTEGTGAVVGWRAPRPAAGLRRHAAARAARCRQHPAAARRAHGRHGARSSPSAVALVTGIVFGLAPALQARGRGLDGALKDAARGSTEGGRRAWMRNALVVSEIAVRLRAAGRRRAADPQPDPRARRRHGLRAPAGGHHPGRSRRRVTTTHEQRNAYVDEVLRRVKAIPGVESAGITDALPLGRNRTWGAPGQGRHLRARPAIPLRVRRASSATAIPPRWAFRSSPAATSRPATCRTPSR